MLRFFKITSIYITIFTALMAGDRPLAMKHFDVNQFSNVYNRGTYMIILPMGFNETYLVNETYGGDFVKFKKTQGFDVEVVSVEDMSDDPANISAQEIKDYIYDYYDTNSMLEYVLLVGDVNGSLKIPTFTIDSYNEEDIDVTDYPYTFRSNQYEPDFFVGRWTIRDNSDFFTLKSRSMQYILMDNVSGDASYLDNALLVAGNYKTADGEEVLPSQWPVTPVWTSLWLMDELQDYGYTEIDTAFFHQHNYLTGGENPLIANSWTDGVGIINYRGWGDANGWHKPYFHKENLEEELNNGWRLPVVMSFVCNTGDFGNDYSGTGLSKCFGEVMITAGSFINPKGAAAMVGPSDLDTDTRFNNVICGIMWDNLLNQNTPELAPALHTGKHALIDEFNGLSAPDGTVIDAFYHHVYAVLGDPSLPVWLKEPGNISSIFAVESPTSDLYQSFVSVILTDEDTGELLPGVVGALLDGDGNLVGKSVSNSNGVLTVDFDTNTSSDLTLYFNAPQYRQSHIELNYISDNGSSSSARIPLDLDIDLVWLYEYSAYDSVDYIPADYAQTVYCNFGIYNSSDQTITLDFELSSPSEFIGDATCDEWYYINGDDGLCHTISDCGPNQYCNVNTMVFTSNPGATAGDMIPFTFSFISDQYEVEDYTFELPVSQNYYSYSTSLPSFECDYGYKAFDHTDTDYDDAPVYDWIEINEVGTNLNLTDDSVINDVQIGFDFTYYGETYNSMTVCSNGWASFEFCDLAHFWNFSIPHAMGPSGMLAPFMDDLDDNGGTVPLNVYAYNTGDGRFIVEWDHVLNGEDDQDCPNCIDETFQMILFDPAVYSTVTGDGEIVFQYKEVYDIDQNGNYSTIGIESPSQEDGVEYLFSSNVRDGSYWEASDNGAYENIAIKFTTGAGTPLCTSMDLNNDGIINVVDIINVVNIVIGGGTDDPAYQCAADVNSDGIINVIDIIQIVNYITS